MLKKWKSMANITQVIVSDNREWDPSVTQPDETLSIREILHRVSQGMTTGLGDQPGAYDDEEDEDFGDPTLDPEFDKLDALAISTCEEADQVRADERERQRKRRKKKEDEAFQKRVDEEIARRAQQPDHPVS